VELNLLGYNAGKVIPTLRRTYRLFFMVEEQAKKENRMKLATRHLCQATSKKAPNNVCLLLD
jgi:hypothetical protein